MQQPPLVVDLDGTLIRTDLLVETGLEFLRSSPSRMFAPLVWLASGKARLKAMLAVRSTIDAATLPYDHRVIALIERERAHGRHIVLATASHRLLAERVSAHLKLFDDVLATEGDNNLSARAKRDRLVETYGEKGFDYVGNSRDDLVVWQAARQAWVVNPDAGVTGRAQALGNVVDVMPHANQGMWTWFHALRAHQWVKNLLLFVPLLASHRFMEPALVGNGILAFLLFSLCASSVYLLNDLLDLPDDRSHPSKRGRPFASGAASVKTGLVVAPLLLLVSALCSLYFLPPAFTAALAGYYLLTLAYSVLLKRLMVVDVIALAVLYTLRIVAGALALDLALTFWILAFSVFMFLNLALVKRYAELHAARQKGARELARGRGYYPDDLAMISSLGAAAGYISTAVLALYIQDQQTVSLYRHPQVIWLACPLLLYWVSRVWLIAHRGQMHEDPVVFAIRDRASLVTGVLFALIFWLAA